MNRLLLAIGFLTNFPVRLKEAPGPGDLGRSAVWFPILGLAIGAISALIYWLGSIIFSITLGAVLATASWVVLSGGLHLDGLADCCDGMLNASSPERRLEIMKDPRLGSFGGIGLFLALLIKFAAIYTLSPLEAMVALPLAAGLGRWLLLMTGKQPMARPGGMGADFAAGLSQLNLPLAILPLVPLIVLNRWGGLLAVLMVHLTALGIFKLARNRLGGVTGDVMGMTVEVTELVALLSMIAI